MKEFLTDPETDQEKIKEIVALTVCSLFSPHLTDEALHELVSQAIASVYLVVASHKIMSENTPEIDKLMRLLGDVDLNEEKL